MDSAQCEKAVLDFFKEKIASHRYERDLDSLRKLQRNIELDVLGNSIIDINKLEEEDNEKTYVLSNTSRDKDSPDFFYYDINTEWFQFTKPIMEPQTVIRTKRGGGHERINEMVRYYKNFKENDLLTIWQTIGSKGAEHLVCIIISGKSAYSFGFGFTGGGQKLDRRVSNIIGGAASHFLDEHMGAIYTPDYLFENRLYDQLIKKRTAVTLIANSYLRKEHIERFNKYFDPIEFRKDMKAVVTSRMVSTDLFRTCKMLKGRPDCVSLADELTDIYNYMVIVQGNLLKRYKALLDEGQNPEDYQLVLKMVSGAIKKLTDAIERAKKNKDGDKNFRPLTYIRYIIPTEMKYCEWTRNPLIYGKAAGSNCASFMHRLFGDIIECSGESLVFNPKWCKQRAGSERSSCVFNKK